ncbi:hypothetical protein F2P81_018145 [Scophthalmus maximus]|uniref:Crossover junction endonuclease MUS81 n=1 Tax=Scophthalmus maximus TaxID=52904 RepID=A0A6A4SBE9_SCOMX|nr:hypothetical protein F2P81_018145 [Scophthalmus maximus]
MPASEPHRRLGRKRALPPCPNPLFLRWLTELRDQAQEKGLKIQYTYQKAINSLNKYPLPLQNAKEAKILQNFGDGICKILDDKLQRHLRENGPDAPIHSLPEGAPPAGRADNNSNSLAPTRKPDLGSKYTAWSSVSTLIQKSLLVKTHNPARYSLSEEGLALAERLDAAERGSEARGEGSQVQEEEEEGGPGVVDLTASDEEEEEEDRTHPAKTGDSQTETETKVDATGSDPQTSRKPNAGLLLPGTYEIVLCVDFIETTGGGGSSHQRKQELVKELQRNGVNFDIRKLNVGDFLWTAREKVAPVPGQLRAAVGRELVLDYVIERKRMDDLCGSIIDGRFREQKFRLKRCGLRRPVYLVEECGAAASHLSLPEATLQQAIVNTQVVDGFFVKRVQDVRESAAYLTIMTRYLTKLYQNRTLVCRSRELEGDGASDEERGSLPSCSLMSFTEFNHGAVKNKSQTVREVFARQLMQISGLSGDKAAAILERYSTPYSLLSAYEQCSSEAEKEKLLSSIRYGKLNRNLGPALSRTVWQLYCSQGVLT